MAKIVAFPLAIIMSILSFFFPGEKIEPTPEKWNTNHTYVFVHGLMGWGEYDFYYDLFPYWGTFGGDLMSKLNDKGFDCHAATVNGTASAWDRACELYAQLTGTVVDYGEEHSQRCGHDRFGEDFTDRALIKKWDAENKINLLGHSFGGATMRLFASLMAIGSAEERAATDADEISPLFTGGKEDWIYSLTALAAPNNGTTSYSAPAEEIDTAAYDMYIDNAMALNNRIYTSNQSYYFSIPCSATVMNEDGTYSAEKEIMEVLFTSSADEIGKYAGTTVNGYEFGEEWFENDGLVNTISAKAPTNAEAKDFDPENIPKGIWNVMPTYRGDHMSLQGGLLKTNTDVERLYTEHLNIINCL